MPFRFYSTVKRFDTLKKRAVESALYVFRVQYVNFAKGMRTVVDVRANMHPASLWPVRRQGTGARCQIGTDHVVQSRAYHREQPIARMTYVGAEKDAEGVLFGLFKIPSGVAPRA
jgi:hypothetical protein